MTEALAFIDFETTGLSPDAGDRIFEVGMAVLHKGRIVDRYQSFVNPEMRIPYEVVALTGIDDAMVRPAPKAMQVMHEVLEFVGKLPLVAHNASFDKRFMDSELSRIRRHLSNEFICSLRVARRVYPAAPNHKLATLVRLAKVTPADGWFVGAHDGGYRAAARYRPGVAGDDAGSAIVPRCGCRRVDR